MQVKEFIKFLKKHNNLNDEICWDIWTKEDVYEKASEFGYEINDEIANKTLKMMEDRKDASFGLNWDVLELYMMEVIEQKDKK